MARKTVTDFYWQKTRPLLQLPWCQVHVSRLNDSRSPGWQLARYRAPPILLTPAVLFRSYPIPGSPAQSRLRIRRIPEVNLDINPRVLLSLESHRHKWLYLHSPKDHWNAQALISRRCGDTVSKRYKNPRLLINCLKPHPNQPSSHRKQHDTPYPISLTATN